MKTNGKTPAHYQPNGTGTLHGALLEAPPPPAGPATVAPAIEMIPLHRIEGSESNPRTDFDTEKLEELANSIREHGILSPLQVRPIFEEKTNRKDPFNTVAGFELIAGERRLRAAQIAGLDLVPCIIRRQPLTKTQILEIQVIENEQREDLSPLEKAGGYNALVALGVSVEDLAQRVGKSTATIYGLLKLMRLPPAARKAVEEGKLPASTAQLIGRIPDPEARKKAAEEILAGDEWGDHKGEPMSYRQSLEMIQTDFMVELKKAPFSLNDRTLVLSAGACKDCVKRTGNNPDYQGSRADICTDPKCFRQKVEASAARLVAQETALGKKVIAGPQAEKVFGQESSSLHYDSPYLDLERQFWQGKYNGQVLKTLLKGKLKDQEIITAVDPLGFPHQLVDKKKAFEILKIRGSTSSFPRKTPAQAKAARAKEKAKEEGILKAALKIGGSLLGDQPDAKIKDVLHSLIEEELSRSSQPVLQPLCRFLGVAGKTSYDQRKALQKLIDGYTLPDALMEFLLQIHALRMLLSPYTQNGHAKNLSKVLGLKG